MGKRKSERQAYEPTKVPTAMDVIFAAGFYEGEGCVCLANKKQGGKAIQVVIGQKDPEILYRMRDFFGGAVYIRKNSGANKINLHAWVMWGYYAKPFLRAIFPLLSTRRKTQIETVCPDLNSVSVTTARLPFPEKELMIQSDLHGNMQSLAETTKPVN
jgi:hypothetical protein